MTKEEKDGLIVTFIGCCIGSCIGQILAYIIFVR